MQESQRNFSTHLAELKEILEREKKLRRRPINRLGGRAG
jgi:hypothetical protein